MKKRKLVCKSPKCPHERELLTNDWLRTKLSDGTTGLLVSDIDFMIWNYKTKQCMMIEVKSMGAEIKFWQRDQFQRINKWIKAGIISDPQWTYLGFHYLRFNKLGNDFKAGVTLDGKLITEEELIKFLSFNMQDKEVIDEKR